MCKETLHFCKAVNMDSVYLNTLSLRDIPLSGGTSALLGPSQEILDSFKNKSLRLKDKF